MNMAGETWVNATGDPLRPFIVEFGYERIAKGQAVRAHGAFGVGTPQETEIQTMYGWDPENKSASTIWTAVATTLSARAA